MKYVPRFLIAAAALLLSSCVLPAPSLAAMPRGSYLTTPCVTVPSLVKTVTARRAVRLRYAQHWGISEDEVIAKLRGLRLAKLDAPLRARVYYWRSRTGYRVLDLPAGKPVFVDAMGRPVLVQECGNPIAPLTPPIATDVPDKTPITPSLMVGVEPELEWEPQPSTPTSTMAPGFPDTLLPSAPNSMPSIPFSGAPMAEPFAFRGPTGGGGGGGFGWFLPIIGAIPFLTGGGGGGGGIDGVTPPLPIVAAVPEVSTFWMMCSGGGLAAGALLIGRRRNRAK